MSCDNCEYWIPDSCLKCGESYDKLRTRNVELIHELASLKDKYALAEQWGWRPDIAQLAYIKMVAERDELKEQLHYSHKVCREVEAECDALRAENARLRKGGE